jgi:hypothetical protein
MNLIQLFIDFKNDTSPTEAIFYGLRPFPNFLMSHDFSEDGFSLKIDAQTTFEALCFIKNLDPGQNKK